MNELTAELHTLVAELEVAGVPATVDPGAVQTLVTRYGVCALVQPAATYAPITYGLDFDMVVPVLLITAGPYDNAAAERLDEALILSWGVTRPAEPVTRDTYEQDTFMPALLIPTPRHVNCLT